MGGKCEEVEGGHVVTGASLAVGASAMADDPTSSFSALGGVSA